MAHYWKTDTTLRQKQVAWPSTNQIGKQVGLALLIVVIWSGMLFGYLRLNDTDQPSTAVSEREPDAEVAQEPPPVVPTSTATPQPSPTDTPIPIPTEATDTESSSVTFDNEPVTETPIVELSPTSTKTNTLEPLPTQTPPPSTDEPVASEDETGEVSFSQDVFPIIDRRCTKCHGGGTNDDGSPRIEEGLSMLTYEDLLAGSWNGPVIEPGDVENSYLIEQISTGEMPKKEPDLLPNEIRIIRAWVEAGAPNN